MAASTGNVLSPARPNKARERSAIPYWNPVAQQCVLCFRSEARRHKAAAESQWVEGRTTEGLLVMTDGKDELAENQDNIRRTRFSKQVRQKARHELKKLPQVSPMSGEATVTRSFE